MEYLHVVAAAIVNENGETLIALRPENKHQGGLWEFPGGKVEADEGVLTALTRELHEELGINLKTARPLIRVKHCYPDKAVLLDVWRVDEFEGMAHGREGQATEWVRLDRLGAYTFPEANWPIIKAVQLPDAYVITPEPESKESCLTQLENVLASGRRLVQLRAKKMDVEPYKELVNSALEACHRHGARMLINASPELAMELGADGVHLASNQLKLCLQRPLADDLLVAASCHSEQELQHAVKIGADFALLSPVKATQSHPDDVPLGWSRFQSMVDAMPIPVYALGGMTLNDREESFRHGGQGVAAIRALWNLD